MKLISYFKDTVTELKLVTWPTKAQTIKLTAVVIGISVIVGAYVGGLDYMFTNLLTLVFK